MSSEVTAAPRWAGFIVVVVLWSAMIGTALVEPAHARPHLTMHSAKVAMLRADPTATLSACQRRSRVTVSCWMHGQYDATTTYDWLYFARLSHHRVIAWADGFEPY